MRTLSTYKPHIRNLIKSSAIKMTAPFARALIIQTKHRTLSPLSHYSCQARTLASLRNSRDPRDLRGPRGSSGRPVVNRKLIEPAPSTNQQTLPTTPNYSLENPSLLAPVHVPEDKNATLRSDHPAARLLENSALVVSRQLELMNVMLFVPSSIYSSYMLHRAWANIVSR